MNRNQILDYMDSLEKEDDGLDSYVNVYEALSVFFDGF